MKELYNGKYDLESYEILFMDSFEHTHSLDESLGLLTKRQKERIKGALRQGKLPISKCYKEFIRTAPIHPEANKVVILDNLVWIMHQAKEDKDTGGVLRAISEINKMIKGNLVNSTEKTIVQQKLIGVIDLTNQNKEEEPIMIDV